MLSFKTHSRTHCFKCLATNDYRLGRCRDSISSARGHLNFLYVNTTARTLWRPETCGFFYIFSDFLAKTEGCMAEEATIRYIFIGHIVSVLHFHWTVESISIWKIHKTAKSICRSNQISGGVRLPPTFKQTFSASAAGWFGKKFYCVRNEPPFISKFIFLLGLNCLYSYLLILI